jgi:predicted nucleic acid-binding protein
MTTRVERFVDTNVLLAATAALRPRHAVALALLEAGFADRSLFLSGQVLREYLCVATRSPAMNGLGLTQGDAVSNVRQFLERTSLLREDESVSAALLRLMAAVPCMGKQVHDANIAAAMVAHGVPRLVTLNAADFARFAAFIEVSDVA